MSLARIVTWLAEDIGALAQDLRARGFEVVTRSPDEISSEPADLEITVEECASEEALTSASGIARAQDKCVFIAPGAITDNPRPIAVTPPPVVMPELAYSAVQPYQSEELEPLVAIHQLEDRSGTLEQIPVLDAAEAVAGSAAVSEPEVSEFALEAVSDPELAPRGEELTEPLAEMTEPLAEEEEELVTHEFAASIESAPTLISEPVLEAPLAAAELASAEVAPSEYLDTQAETTLEVPAFVQAEAISPVETEAVLEMQPEILAEAPAVFEVQPVSLVETEAISQIQPETIEEPPTVPDVEEVWVKAEAVARIQPEAIAEVPAILQTDIWLMEAEPTSDWPIWHPLAETEVPSHDAVVPQPLFKERARAVPLTNRAKTVVKEQLPQVVPLMLNAVPVRPNTYRQRILQKPVVQNDEVFWKTATVLAMVAVAALLVGASANRFSPLPANVVRSIETQQPAPFEKTRIVPALALDAGNKMGTELPPGHGPDVARFHPALAIEPAAPRIARERANEPLVRAKPQPRSAGHPESTMVAEDTVVRYDKKHPPASHTQAQKNSGVKQYTDLD
jgi:hypothetical protein